LTLPSPRRTIDPHDPREPSAAARAAGPQPATPQRAGAVAGVATGRAHGQRALSAQQQCVGHFAERDQWASPASVRELESKLRSLGKQVEFHIYPGTDHAFFNDTRPDVYNPAAAQDAWTRALGLLSRTLKS